MKMNLQGKSRFAQWAALPITPFTFLFVLALVLHLQLTLGTGDDTMNKEMLQHYYLGVRLYEMYDKWSSRQLVDAVMYLVFLLPYFVWRVLNALVLTLCAFFSARLLQVEHKSQYTWPMVGLMLCYEWLQLSSAGWVTTMLNFLWPFAALLAALQPYITHLRGGKTPKWQLALCLVLFGYAVNMEQLLVVIGLLLVVWLFVQLVTKQRVYGYLYAQLLLCGASLLYIMTCPGVPRRMAGEMSFAFKDYLMRSVWQNIELGLANSFSYLMYQRNYLFFLFCLLLAICIWQRYQNAIYRILAVTPLGFVTVLGLFGDEVRAIFPHMAFFRDALTSTGMITVATAGVPKRYLSFLLLCVLFSLCIANLYLAFGHTMDALAGIALLCAGFSSHAMMGFSASIWTSGIRAAFFCNMAVALLCALLFVRHAQKGAVRWRVAQGAIWLCAMAQCASLLGA